MLFAVRAACLKALSLAPAVCGGKAFAISCHNAQLFWQAMENGSAPATDRAMEHTMSHSMAHTTALPTLPPSFFQATCFAKAIPAPPGLAAAVVAADTVVALGSRILGKPAHPEEALAMLQSLAGKEHDVFSAVAILCPAGAIAFAVHTKVRMAPASGATLQRYVGTGEPADKAGAYAIQGIGAFLIEAIAGSWSNVVGLPLAETITALRAYEVLE